MKYLSNLVKQWCPFQLTASELCKRKRVPVNDAIRSINQSEIKKNVEQENYLHGVYK